LAGRKETGMGRVKVEKPTKEPIRKVYKFG